MADQALTDEELQRVSVQMPGAATRRTTAPGFVSRADEEQAQAEAEQEGFFSALSDSFTSGGNILYQTLAAVDRKSRSGPADDNWKGDVVDDWIKKNGIDPYDEWRYKATGNMQEAEMLRAQQVYNENTQARLARRGGVSTFLAQGIAGIIDVDLPVSIMTGGLTAGAKIGYNATKIGRLMTGASAGALSMGLAGSVSHVVNPAEDWTAIPSMMLMGAGFGAVGGALAKGPDLRVKANEHLDGLRNDFGEHVAEGTPTARSNDGSDVYAKDPYGSRARNEAEEAIAPKEEPRSPQAVRMANVVEDTGEQGGASAGAAQVKPGATINDISSEQSKTIIRNAKQRDSQLGLENIVDDTLESTTAGTAAGHVGQTALNGFQKLLMKMPFTSDFNRLARSQSSVLRVLGYDIMESGAGLLRNNDNAARYFNQYHVQSLNMIGDVPDMMAAWAKEVRGVGKISAAVREDVRLEFNQALRSELNSRFFQRTPNPNVHPIIKQAADIVDNFYEFTGNLEKGRPGQMAAKGMENFQKRSGYVDQRWASSQYRRLVDSGRKHSDIVKAMYENYRQQYPSLKPDDLQVYAAATVDRMRRGSTDSSTSIASWINADGRAAVEDFLARQPGVDKARAKSIIDGLTGSRATKAQPGYTKARMDVDWDFVASNGIRVSDLLENDIYGLMVRRAHRSSGRAALARKGITSRADWETLVQAAMDEQAELVGKMHTPPRASTGNPQLDTAGRLADKAQDWLNNPTAIGREELMEMYKYFDGSPLYGGTSKWVSIMKKVSNLSLLGQLGFAQAAETGVVMAAMGTKKFMQDLPSAVKDAIMDPGSGLHQDLKMLGVYAPDDRLYRFDMAYATESMANDSAMFNRFNHMLNQGGRLQGFTSFFFHAQRVQHKMAVDAAVNKLFMHYNGSKVLSDARLRDILGDHNTLGPKLQQYIQNGTVQFDPDGYVKTLNLDKWNTDDMEAFARAINAQTHQTLQRPLIGESSTAYYKSDLSALFWHLKSFPLLAMEKQFIRNARIADRESLATFLFSLGTAAMAYTAKQAVNLRSDNLDFEHIAAGAINMSNMAGWMPMWLDPIGGMLGMDTGYGRSTSVFSVPPAVPTIDRLLKVPGAFVGEMTASDVYALQALPIVGNMIGMTAIANTWKDHIKESRREQRKQERADARSANQENKPVAQEAVDTQAIQTLGLK